MLVRPILLYASPLSCTRPFSHSSSLSLSLSLTLTPLPLSHSSPLPYPAGLVSALAIPMALNTAMNVALGSKWRVALRRSKVAGRMLADMLLQVG